MGARKEHEWMIEVLDRIIELLKKGWCREACARDAADEIVAYDSARTVSFSLYGAYHRAMAETGCDRDPKRIRKLQSFLQSHTNGTFVRFNDHDARGRREVIQPCTAARNAIAKGDVPDGL